jgi:predicted kinase
MDTVIFDIDGTLADVSHRRHFVAHGKREWGSFFASMHLDSVNDPVRRLNQMLDGRVAIVLCSGRPEDYRAVTEAWLAQWGVVYHRLYMRSSGDHRADHVIKAELLEIMQADGFEPFLVVDDRPSVVAMWRERGLTCLQCADWDTDGAESVAPGLLTIMVGPSGAGKSTWLASPDAAALGIHHSHIISSDQIRADLSGNFRDQTQNDRVFSALHAQAKARVTHGLPTVIDATNLRRKDRLACVYLAPPTGAVRYIVIDRPMIEKRRDAGWRAELEVDLISKHQQIFDSQIKDILKGDGLPNVTVMDFRK